MALKRQKQVMAANDLLAGRAMRSAAEDYRREVLRPIVAAIKKAKTLSGLKRAIGPGLLRRMKTKRFEDKLAAVMTQAAVNGVISATPRQ